MKLLPSCTFVKPFQCCNLKSKDCDVLNLEYTTRNERHSTASEELITQHVLLCLIKVNDSVSSYLLLLFFHNIV